MSRAIPLVLVVVFAGTTTLGRSAPAAPQVVVGQMPPRDPTQPQPPRPVPVGNASISGTITAKDTGRPVRDARVMLSGTASVPEGVLEAMVPPGARAMGPGGATPIGRGSMAATSTLRVNRSLTTDRNGRFSFAKLPAGRFMLSVNRNQFLSFSYGQKRPGGPGSSIPLAEGQSIQLPLQMIRGGVISGTVYSEDGDPVAGIQVRGWRSSTMNGVRRLNGEGYATTDDRGTYRMYNLQPGDYFVAATANANEAQMLSRLNGDSELIEQAVASGKVQPPAAPGFPPTVLVPVPVPVPMTEAMMKAFLPTYFPGTAVRANAGAIHIDGGDERPGADITLQYVEAGVIRGTVASATRAGTIVQVSLSNDDPSAENTNSMARVDEKGTFTFRALAPGKYTVFAQTVPAQSPGMRGAPPPPQGSPRVDDADRQWDRQTVSIDGSSAAQVSLSLKPGRSISGAVLFDTSRPPQLGGGRMTVTLSPALGSQTMMMMSGSPPQVQIEADGSFTMPGVFPGQYIFRLNGAMLKSAVVGGQDTLDIPLDFTGDRDIADALLTATDKTTEVNGTLSDMTGKPSAESMLLAVSTDSRFWAPGSRRIIMTRTGQDGRYVIRTLPPGEYFLTVFDEVESGSQYDPEFLKTLAGRATRVVVIEGTKVTQDLRVGK